MSTHRTTVIAISVGSRREQGVLTAPCGQPPNLVHMAHAICDGSSESTGKSGTREDEGHSYGSLLRLVPKSDKVDQSREQACDVRSKGRLSEVWSDRKGLYSSPASKTPRRKRRAATVAKLWAPLSPMEQIPQPSIRKAIQREGRSFFRRTVSLVSACQAGRVADTSAPDDGLTI